MQGVGALGVSGSSNITLQASMLSNIKIIEKLREEVQHLGSQKVDVLEFEVAQ